MTTLANKLRNAAKTTGLDGIVELLNEAAQALEVQSHEIEHLHRGITRMAMAGGRVEFQAAYETLKSSVDVKWMVTKDSIAYSLSSLLNTAFANGYVITVNLAPGNYVMHGEVRHAR